MPIPERTQALQRQSAKSVVYQTVCDWIITGVMKPGEKILDSELASYFNVSRTPVREALQLLQNQRLVCVIPGRATVVADLDVEDFEKCYRPLAEIDALAAGEGSYAAFFEGAPQMNPDREKISGTVCGVRVEAVADPLLQEIRRLDKLVDELAKGRPLDAVLRA